MPNLKPFCKFSLKQFHILAVLTTRRSTLKHNASSLSCRNSITTVNSCRVELATSQQVVTHAINISSKLWPRLFICALSCACSVGTLTSSVLRHVFRCSLWLEIYSIASGGNTSVLYQNIIIYSLIPHSDSFTAAVGDIFSLGTCLKAEARGMLMCPPAM